MKIVVVGLGYVGLSNAVLLAQQNEVVGVDLSQERVDSVNSRIAPIQDENLNLYLKNENLNLTATTVLENALPEVDYVIISTPTNYDENSNYFDTSSVESVINEVVLQAPNSCIVIKSTIPIGFIDRMRQKFRSENIIFSPEFLREGKALYDNLYPSRIIVGDRSSNALQFSKLLENAALKSNIEVKFMGTREAEAVKLFSNTYLAMRVAFFNELDSYALVNDMNTQDMIEAVSLDPRIGSFYNNPSFGYGGYCLPKDTKQLLSNFEGVPQNLISAIVNSNETRKTFLADTIATKASKVVGIYRLAMKEGSDNFRQSAIIDIIEKLKFKNIEVIIYEPNLNEEEFAECQVLTDLDTFKKVSDVIIANRNSIKLNSVIEKVITRDVFHSDQ